MRSQSQLVVIDCTGHWAKQAASAELVKPQTTYLTHEFEHFTVHQFIRECDEWDSPSLQLQVWSSDLDKEVLVNEVPLPSKVAIHLAVKRFAALAEVDVLRVLHDGLTTHVSFATNEGFKVVPDLSWASFTVKDGADWTGPVEELKVKEDV